MSNPTGCNFSQTNDNVTVSSRKFPTNLEKNSQSPKTAKANFGASKRKFSNKTGVKIAEDNSSQQL